MGDLGFAALCGDQAIGVLTDMTLLGMVQLEWGTLSPKVELPFFSILDETPVGYLKQPGGFYAGFHAWT
ncbi:MAG: hypothetical protein JSW55_05395 [Chloroflexota bacterium]|nr:MAG: hypothetical protein JSW55_05395 [Chloroflexota bacterium]